MIEYSQTTPVKLRSAEKGQGLAEYALILALVAIVCVAVLAVLGRGTKGVFAKVTCTLNSTAAICGCTNETLTVTSAAPNGCVGTTLTVTVASTCSGTRLTVNTTTATTPASITWNNAPVCQTPPAATSFTVTSTQPDGTIKSYNASRP